MVVVSDEDLADLGSVWQSWGGEWGGARDPVHFQYPGFRTPAVPAQESSYWGPKIALAVDVLIGFNPFIGMVELFSALLSWGFPENELLKFFSGPAEYVYQSR